jgi:L-seryl-tRNA(Ser) seleniumtransferase
MTDRRAIPSIEQLRQRDGVQRLTSQFGHEAVVDALRRAAAAWRARLATEAGAPTGAGLAEAIERDAARALAEAVTPSLQPVINATGIIIHTNLGRAPLAPAAIERLKILGDGYSNLEFDLATGSRGSRATHAESLLCRVTGAEAAVVVNNCAAATLLVLAALARGRDVLVSRAELVEIGGGFRVPDVMAQSGAKLREVGTTNRTRVNDYALAIGDRTAAILRVHPSNFRIEGFVERTPLADLAALAHRFDLPLIEDLGSGLSADDVPPALQAEPRVQQVLDGGADVVCFSGDKLLGGPQAGIIAGRRRWIDPVRRHPLMRALRVDKLTYAALEATLVEHVTGRAIDTVPVLRMAALDAQAIGSRAERLAAALRSAGWAADVVDGMSAIGGGSAPGTGIPTRLVALARDGFTADALEESLRRLDPPIIARIERDRVVLDLRTVEPDDDHRIETVLNSEFGMRPPSLVE